MVEEDMKENERLNKGGIQMQDQDRVSIDELDMEGTGELDVDGAQISVPRNKSEDGDIEEYSYHDDVSLSNNDIGHLRGDDDVKVANAGTAKIEQ